MKTKRTENPIWLQAAYAALGGAVANLHEGLNFDEDALICEVDLFVEAIEATDEADRQKEITDADRAHDRALAAAREKFPIGSRARIKADGGWGTVTQVEFYAGSIYLPDRTVGVTISWQKGESGGGITLPPEAFERIDVPVFTQAEVDHLVRVAVEAAVGTAKAIGGET